MYSVVVAAVLSAGTPAPAFGGRNILKGAVSAIWAEMLQVRCGIGAKSGRFYPRCSSERQILPLQSP